MLDLYQAGNTEDIRILGSPAEPTVGYGSNRFSIQNPEISIVSGNDTTMIRTMIDGRVKKIIL